jgi:response regulator RpfG family c-di-GMP phosphodiesterase
MNAITKSVDPISVLVVDQEPLILVSIAKILDANRMRGLLARNGSEAVEIAEWKHIPIDLILINTAILELREPDLLGRLRRIRSGIRHLCMATCVGGDIARIQLMTGGPGTESAICDDGIVESIRKAASAPLVQRAGLLN